jgi:hypothetical protein
VKVRRPENLILFFLLQQKCAAKPMQGYPPRPVLVKIVHEEEVEEINWGGFGIASFLFQTGSSAGFRLFVGLHTWAAGQQ